ncbi:MAG: hypothetical protein QOJ76_1984 [Acidobacteriota bacterium]|jgi:hypothetical protein|nr:hypothetical protein [Acidobacteriota bacterium]
MKKLGLTTALMLTLICGAGSVFAQNTNGTTNGNMSGGGGGSMSRHHRRHHRTHHRRHHRKSGGGAANTNTNR